MPSTSGPVTSYIGRPLNPPDHLCLGRAALNPAAGLPASSDRNALFGRRKSVRFWLILTAPAAESSKMFRADLPADVQHGCPACRSTNAAACFSAAQAAATAVTATAPASSLALHVRAPAVIVRRPGQVQRPAGGWTRWLPAGRRTECAARYRHGHARNDVNHVGVYGDLDH